MRVDVEDFGEEDRTSGQNDLLVLQGYFLIVAVCAVVVAAVAEAAVPAAVV